MTGPPPSSCGGAGLRVTAAHVAPLGTVRDLHALTAAGTVRRVEQAGSPARFEGRVEDNHHHVVYRSYGVVADADRATGEAPCPTASDDHGFSTDEAEVVHGGLAPRPFHRPQFLSTVIRLVRKDSHV
ncbi:MULTISPECIES: transcriptional repressor [unclassified Streptomyces]|uniref:transcriptional repressor n=1 Tax=unclassified Streptomyces TaxID=2593676 RepID=UPI002E81F9DD|nr:transcriptional repressor [Streptomyces sp. NBC_00589]